MKPPTEHILRDYYEKKTRDRITNYNQMTWQRVGDVVDQLGADPYIFIDAQFASYVPPTQLNRNGFIKPQFLHKIDSIQRYQSYVSQAANDLENQIRTQILYIQGLVDAKFPDGKEISKQESIKFINDILLDPQSPIRPFARILLCNLSHVDRILELFYEKIVAELNFNPGLKNYIKKKYGSRYSLIYAKRVSEGDGGEHTNVTRVCSEVRPRRIVSRKLQQAHP